jgi:hypothetical protein
MDGDRTFPAGSRRARVALLVTGAVVLVAAAVGVRAALGAAGGHDGLPGGSAGLAAASTTVGDPDGGVTVAAGGVGSGGQRAPGGSTGWGTGRVARRGRLPAGRRPPRAPAPPCRRSWCRGRAGARVNRATRGPTVAGTTTCSSTSRSTASAWGRCAPVGKGRRRRPVRRGEVRHRRGLRLRDGPRAAQRHDQRER